MNKRIQLLPAVLVTFMLLALPGCFTGIEGTAKIKYSSSKGDMVLSAEESILDNAMPVPISQWERRKEFILTDGRLDMAYSPLSIVKTLQPYDTIYYNGVRDIVTLSGDTVSEILFIDKHGNEIYNRVKISKLKLFKLNQFSVPFTIDVDVIQRSSDILTGLTVWPIKPLSDGIKYSKRGIIAVQPGDSEYPIMLKLNNGDSIKILLSNHNSSSRNFANLFSLTDPKLNYPQITDSNWELICHGKVAIGMSNNECRLALGAPKSIDRITGYNGLNERWTYDDGKYLIFVDGILTSFRE